MKCKHKFIKNGSFVFDGINMIKIKESFINEIKILLGLRKRKYKEFTYMYCFKCSQWIRRNIKVE